MGTFEKLYAPSPSVVVSIEGSSRAGLVAVTVTPGNAPPLSSMARPRILALETTCADALGSFARTPQTARAIRTPTRREIDLPIYPSSKTARTESITGRGPQDGPACTTGVSRKR